MKFGGYDNILIADILLLLVFGLIVISSASVVVSYENYDSNFYMLYSQIVKGVLPGLVCAAVLSRIDYHIYKKYAPLFLLATMALLLSVFVPGIGDAAKGASRWIELAGIRFQPSELAKLTFLLYLAAWLEKRKNRIGDIQEGVIPFLFLVALVALPVMKQPDLGTLLIIGSIALVMYFMAGAPLKHMAAIIICGATTVMFYIQIEPYRKNRFDIFLNPDMDQQGTGYQINQALLAIGSGGVFGLGLGHSRQKFNYLPEAANDSIFAIIGEELGLVGVIFLLSLYLIFAMRGLGIVERTRDDFGKLLATGVTFWITFQAILNIGAITSLVPLTGIPLPFVSSGGSAVMSLLMGIGVLLSVSKFGSTYKK